MHGTIISYLAYNEKETPLLTASREMEEKESEQNWAPSSIASSSSSYIKDNENVTTRKIPGPFSNFPYMKQRPKASTCLHKLGPLQNLWTYFNLGKFNGAKRGNDGWKEFESNLI